jgi:hypothetical protein
MSGSRLQLWLGFRLNTFGSLAVLATALLCVMDKDILSASAGLAISNSLQQLVSLPYTCDYRPPDLTVGVRFSSNGSCVVWPRALCCSDRSRG